MATFFKRPSFQVVNSDFGDEDNILGGYYTPAQKQLKLLGQSLYERLSGRMPKKQVVSCEKKYLIDWKVMQRYGIPITDVPREYTVLNLPFSERYSTLLFIGMLLGFLLVVATIAILTYSFVRERKHKLEVVSRLKYEHEILKLAIEDSNTFVWRREGSAVYRCTVA